jgi:hypothetical protein
MHPLHPTGLAGNTVHSFEMTNEKASRYYAEEQGFGELIEFSQDLPPVTSPFDVVSGKRTTPFPPDIEDLVRIAGR